MFDFLFDLLVDQSPGGKHGGDVDDPSVAGFCEFFSQKVGQQKVGEVVCLRKKVGSKTNKIRETKF